MINKDFKRSKHPAQLLACLRTHPAQLLACIQYSPCSTASLHTSTHPAQLLACIQVRTLLNCQPAYLALSPLNCLWSSAPEALLCLRTGAPETLLCLRMYALFSHCTCIPSGIDDFKTSERTQTVRSTDLNMRRRDLSPSVDSPYLDLD